MEPRPTCASCRSSRATSSSPLWGSSSGLLGPWSFSGLFAILLWRVLVASLSARDRFGQLLAVGRRGLDYVPCVRQRGHDGGGDADHRAAVAVHVGGGNRLCGDEHRARDGPLGLAASLTGARRARRGLSKPPSAVCSRQSTVISGAAQVPPPPVSGRDESRHLPQRVGFLVSPSGDEGFETISSSEATFVWSRTLLPGDVDRQGGRGRGANPLSPTTAW